MMPGFMNDFQGSLILTTQTERMNGNEMKWSGVRVRERRQTGKRAVSALAYLCNSRL